jgi:hypothetical protein
MQKYRIMVLCYVSIYGLGKFITGSNGVKQINCKGKGKFDVVELPGQHFVMDGGLQVCGTTFLS